MPLRFDQPSLLGKWEGDPTIIHQAFSQINQSRERQKVRLHDEKMAKGKRPSYKIDTAKAPFQKDQELIGQHVNAAIEAVNRGENPEAVLQKAEQVAAMSQAQKNALEQSKAQTNELQQAYGNAIDPTPISNSINSAYNDHDINTRGQVLGEIQKHIADPSEKMFNSEKHTSNIFLARPEQSLVYTNKDENRNVNIGNERKVTGRLLVPDTKRPQYEWKNNKKVPVIDSNGQPVYEMRNATTIDEALPEAKSLFNNDRNYADWTTKQVARTDKGTIDELTAEWISSERNRPDGGVPSKETIEAKKQLIARDLAERKVAKQLLQLDRGATVLNDTRTLDEPKSSGGVQKDAVAAVLDEAVNTDTNVGGVEKRKPIYRPNAIVLTNSKPQNYNLSGDVINVDDNSRAKFTGSTNATLSTLYTRMKIGDKNFIFEAEDKNGNKLPPPTHEKIMQTIRNTPVGTKIKSDVHGIMDIVTKDNTKGVMSQGQIARLEELKTWEKTHPESTRIPDKGENLEKRKELYNLRSQTQNPNQTVSAEAVNSGNLFRAFGVKTIEEGARSKKLSPEVRQRFSQILEQQKAIEEHNSRVQTKTMSFEHDGKIYNIPKEKEASFLKSFPNAKRK